MTSEARRIGDAAEELVARRLADEGWLVLGRNLRFGRGELDIVAVDPGPPAWLVVVEVRWRARRDFGLPEETFGRAKRTRLWRAASALVEAGRLADGRRVPHLPMRVDLVVVEPATLRGDPPRVRHHRAALGRS